MNDKRTNESPLLFIKDSLIGECEEELESFC